MFKFPINPGALAALACVFLCAAASSAPATPGKDEHTTALQLAIAAEQQRAAAAAPRLERADLLLRPGIGEPRLSPDGQWLAYLREGSRDRSVWLLPANGGKPRQLLARSTAQSLHWTGDGHWLLLQSSRELFALAVDGQTGSGTVTTLSGASERMLLGVDSSRPAAVIVRERTATTQDAPGRWQLRGIDVHGGSQLLLDSGKRLVDFVQDDQGRIAFVAWMDGDNLLVQKVAADGSFTEVLRCERLQRCSLLATRDPGGLLLRSDVARNRSALLQLDDRGILQELHSDPDQQSDLDDVVLDPQTAQPLIASYRSARPDADYGLTAEARGHLQVIRARLPRSALRLQIGAGPYAHWLVGEGDSTLPTGRWFLYDPKTTQLRQVLDEPGLRLRDNKLADVIASTSLAQKLPVSWTASDGLQLHGFLMLPPGLDPATRPLLTLVHGGPWNQARAEFGAFSQLLVNRGYAVFEPNFRGSTGLGRDHLLAPRGDFGHGRVQQDIVEGTRFLLDNGIGDPQRVGIAGASFGGYSALLGVSFDPELFKVAIAIVPPTDLAWDLTWVARSSEALNLSGNVPFDRWLRMLDLDLTDTAAMTRLHRQSPLANVARMNRPLLLIAGAEDRRVALRGIAEYAARLKLAGKPFSLFVDPDAGHSNDTPVAREATLYLIERMLHQHLGGALPTPPDAAVRAYLQRTQQVWAEVF